MIIRIRPGQPQLAVRIAEAGHEGRQLVSDQLQLVIREPEFSCVRFSEWKGTPCMPGFSGYAWDTDETPSPPVLVYPCFEISDHGWAVFRLDDLIWRRKPGRYTGQIQFTNGYVVTTLDLDLTPGRYVADFISLADAAIQETCL